MEVGIRELKNHLSRYLDHVRDGDEVVVTDRGRAIAASSRSGTSVSSIDSSQRAS